MLYTPTPTTTYTPPSTFTIDDLLHGSEDMRRLLAYKYDPVKFALAGGFNPDPWQVRFLRSGRKRRMLNCSRQVGKSTVVAYGALHRAVYYPGSLILLLSPGERQSLELMRKVYSVLHYAPHHPPLLQQAMTQMEFANGSRILALPGKEETLRGYSAVDILVVDEASRVPDELFFAVEPMLAVSNGEMWTLSSPYGTRGWWHEQHKQMLIDIKMKRKPAWDYYEVPATMIPGRLTPEFLAKAKRSMGEWWFMQEFMCVFLDAQKAAFGAAEVDAAFSEEVIEWTL